MNRRHRGLASLVILSALWPVASVAEPAGAGAATKPAAATPSPAAPVTVPPVAFANPAGSREIIDDFVAKNVSNLLNDGDPVGRAKSRENLSAATMTAGAPAAPAFLLEYGRSLNAALVQRLAPANKPTLLQRLNAAIVVARVAIGAQNASLEPITVQLINDPAEPVLMWALKAAQPQIPQVLGMRVGNAAPRLLTAIAPAVFKHPNGPIFDEAYSALNVNDAQVKDELLKLWGNRLTQYQLNKEAPDDADVDGEPVFTLTTSEMWKTVLVNPKARLEVVQMIYDQLSLSTQWADQTAQPEKREQLAKLVKQCCEGFQVVGDHQDLPGLKLAASTGVGLDARRANLPTKLMPVVQPLLAEIPKAFPGVKPPPLIGGAPGGAAPAAAGSAAAGAQP